MAGSILNPNTPLLPLTALFTDVDARDRWEAEVTPETLPEATRGRALWQMRLKFGDCSLLPLFDLPRLVVHHHRAMQPYLATNMKRMKLKALSETQRLLLGADQLPYAWLGDVVILGPGWEGSSADLYWAMARAVHRWLSDGRNYVRSDSQEAMVKLAVEAMLRSHGRI